MENNIVVLENIHKTYPSRSGGVEALKGVSLTLEQGGFMAVTGSSGSGKTTLMNVVGLLDRADSGRCLIGGRDVSRLSDRDLSRVRNRELGFIFQSFNLIPSMTALENVMLPLSIRGMSLKERRARAMEALASVGLESRRDHRPGMLSGGQRQRVAAARAMACETPLILADEPTGSLDRESALSVMELLLHLNRRGTSILLITHDPSVASLATSRAEMRDGRLERVK